MELGRDGLPCRASRSACYVRSRPTAAPAHARGHGRRNLAREKLRKAGAGATGRHAVGDSQGKPAILFAAAGGRRNRAWAGFWDLPSPEDLPARPGGRGARRDSPHHHASPTTTLLGAERHRGPARGIDSPSNGSMLDNWTRSRSAPPRAKRPGASRSELFTTCYSLVKTAAFHRISTRFSHRVHYRLRVFL